MANIRIKDLISFSGAPSLNEFLAIDGAGETKKITSGLLSQFIFLKNVPSGDDLDDYRGEERQGFYYISTGVVNSPTNRAALMVMSKGSFTLQFIIRGFHIYWRDYSGNPLAWGKWRKAENTEYYAGEQIRSYDTFVGKGTQGQDGYYGCVVLPKTVPAGASVTIDSISQFGTWFSDGQSHTVDLDNIDTIAPERNLLWFKIPATNVQTNSIMWCRISLTASFS